MRKTWILALALALAGPARAAVTTSSSVVEYVCNGATKTYTVPFRFLAAGDLRVSRILTAAPNTETVLALTTAYSVGGAGSTAGSVTLVTPATACPVGNHLRIRRLTPRTQPTSLPVQGPLATKAIEGGLDRGAMISQELNDGQLLAKGWFDFTVHGPPDTALVTATGSTIPRSLADRFGEVATVLDFIPENLHAGIRDGTNTTALDAYLALAIAEATASGKWLDFGSGGTFKIGSLVSMPQFVRGNFTITGAGIRWYRYPWDKPPKQIGEIRADSIRIAGVYSGEFDSLITTGDTVIDGGGEGNTGASAPWGTFWCTFDNVKAARLILDADVGQSVNQNTFKKVVASGLWIRGVLPYSWGVDAPREVHNNVFLSVDTSHANLTASSGATGYHVLNDSTLNQPNTIHNWYAENSETPANGGFPSVLGNWSVLGSNVDSPWLTPFIGGRRNHYLLSGNAGRNGDFFAGTPVNAARGGDWGELSSIGVPLSLDTLRGYYATVVSVSDAPDGNPRAALLTPWNGPTSNWRIIYSLGTSSRLTLTAYVKLNFTPVQNGITFEIHAGADNTPEAYVGASATPLGGGWYLLRLATNNSPVLGSGATTGELWVQDPESNGHLYTVGSFFVAQEQTAFLPSYKRGPIEAFGTTAPTAGIWSAGDLWRHTAPAAGASPGGMCVAAGTPGTWKALPVLGGAAAQADSTAADVAGLKTDLNALLAKLRTAGLLVP